MLHILSIYSLCVNWAHHNALSMYLGILWWFHSKSIYNVPTGNMVRACCTHYQCILYVGARHIIMCHQCVQISHCEHIHFLYRMCSLEAWWEHLGDIFNIILMWELSTSYLHFDHKHNFLHNGFSMSMVGTSLLLFFMYHTMLAANA
jgi:hypothetical protein